MQAIVMGTELKNAMPAWHDANVSHYYSQDCEYGPRKALCMLHLSSAVHSCAAEHMFVVGMYSKLCMCTVSCLLYTGSCVNARLLHKGCANAGRLSAHFGSDLQLPNSDQCCLWTSVYAEVHLKHNSSAARHVHVHVPEIYQ